MLIPDAIKIRTILCEQRISVKELASNAGLRIGTVYEILNNPARRPHYATLYNLAKGLGVGIEDLCRITPEIITGEE